MAKFDLSVTYLKPESFELTEASRMYLKNTPFLFPLKYQGKKMTAVLSFGNGSLWLGFDPTEELALEVASLISSDNLLFAVPVALDAEEVLVVDYVNDRFIVVNVDLNHVLPES